MNISQNQSQVIFIKSIESPIDLFSTLKDPAFFNNVKVETIGYAVYWHDMINISEYELWKNGVNEN